MREHDFTQYERISWIINLWSMTFKHKNFLTHWY